MKVGNLCRTFDSSEVGGECLEDKGTVKEPLPFLRSVKLLLDTEHLKPYLFVVLFSIFVQKVKILKMILCNLRSSSESHRSSWASRNARRMAMLVDLTTLRHESARC